MLAICENLGSVKDKGMGGSKAIFEILISFLYKLIQILLFIEILKYLKKML